MVATVFALILTVLMGGIIAYNGDLIGRKFGKRRVSLLGLRPKHTAILITSVTGIFISGLTTGVLFMLVPAVRDVILRGEQAIRDLPKYRQQARESQLQSVAAGQQTILAQRDAEVAKQSATRAARENAEAQKSLN